MAKPNKKKPKKAYETIRNWVAISAHFATGGGKHQDRRTRRCRTRSAKNKAAMAEYC